MKQIYFIVLITFLGGVAQADSLMCNFKRSYYSSKIRKAEKYLPSKDEVDRWYFIKAVLEKLQTDLNALARTIESKNASTLKIVSKLKGNEDFYDDAQEKYCGSNDPDVFCTPNQKYKKYYDDAIKRHDQDEPQFKR